MPTARDVLATKNSAVVYTCAADAPVQEAARLLRDRKVGALVVLEGGAVSGFVDERELVVRALAAGLDPATPVRDVMRRDLPTVPLHASTADLEALLRRRKARHAAVVGARGLLGVVSLGDLARFQAARERDARGQAEAPLH